MSGLGPGLRRDAPEDEGESPNDSDSEMPLEGEEEIEEIEDDHEIEEEEEEEPDAPPVIVASRRPAAAIQPRRTSPRPSRRSPLRPIGLAVAVTIAAYALLAAALARDPTAAYQSLSAAPLLGKLLGDDHLLAWRLEVSGLHGGLDYIRDHRLAYVVSGRAVNTTDQALRIIEVEGTLVVDDAGDSPPRRQRVYAANQARSTIRDLSAGEVEMLLHLEPSKSFRIRPGESASFLLVFPDPPAGLREVSVRIVDARRT